ncbi:DsrH/TusB family sulfur metabolism protein [Acinetobacter shaoyimingii]|uniref:Sulfurtransferase complex subunit TusB n=1 Tax=Acinetobacter shaoyimingii TaxID=2715164 RepID=A0A6G8RVL6_9GAMM|nr:hypothetical protein [Acinetobacter shaoyimingii]NHB57452.1 hypothetical protein [Acinetobacter shaoyimingii]QIO05954.1 hypothetical protein G8E00_08320 [Acinetobacter shaoyimingii]
MSKNTLYLVQSTFSNTPHVLDKIAQIYGTEDAIFLMGESALYVHDERLKPYAKLYVLNNDAEMLTSELASHVHLLNYAQFADLVLSFKRSISLK